MSNIISFAMQQSMQTKKFPQHELNIEQKNKQKEVEILKISQTLLTIIFLMKNKQEVEKKKNELLLLLFPNSEQTREFLIKYLKKKVIDKAIIEKIKEQKAIQTFNKTMDEIATLVDQEQTKQQLRCNALATELYTDCLGYKECLGGNSSMEMVLYVSVGIAGVSIIGFLVYKGFLSYKKHNHKNQSVLKQ